MGLRLKFNLVLAGILLLGLIAATLVVARVADNDAREQLRQQINVLRAQALAVRKYTADEVRPLLSDASKIQFLPQTVPAFAAHAAFASFKQRFPDFSYKEAALNPTNPADRADDWETAIIEKLRADRKLEEIVEVRETADGARYTVAFPLEIKSESCLACHSTPQKAPKSMIAVYGDKNGFGWKMNEVVGAQIISVPLAVASTQTWQNIKLFGLAMATIFLVLMVLLNVLLSWMVITPVTRMAHLAEAVSMGDNDEPEYVVAGSDEIASLSQSFNRMRRSLDNAMKMLDS